MNFGLFSLKSKIRELYQEYISIISKKIDLLMPI